MNHNRHPQPGHRYTFVWLDKNNNCVQQRSAIARVFNTEKYQFEFEDDDGDMVAHVTSATYPIMLPTHGGEQYTRIIMPAK